MTNRQNTRRRHWQLLFSLLVIIVAITWAPVAQARTKPMSLNTSGNININPSVDPIGKSDGFSIVLYNNNNGLPSSDVNAIAQTRDGFMWIGTYTGLIRYDGHTFERLDSARDIASTRCMYVDSKGRLWVGSNANGIFLMENGSFRNWGKEDGLSSLSIRSIAEDKSGMMYVATADGMVTIDKNMQASLIRDDRIDGHTLYEVRLGSDGQMYGLSSTGDLYVLRAGKITAHVRRSDYAMEDIITMLPDPEHPGYLYVGTDHHLCHGTLEEPIDSWEQWDLSPLHGLKRLEYIAGNVWICARTGVGCFDQEKLSLLTENPMNDAFCQIMTDEDGDIWIASDRQGVEKIVPNQFTDLFNRYDLPPEVVNSTCLRNKQLFIATDNGLRVIEDGHVLDKLPITKATTASGTPIETSDLIEYLDGIRIRSIIRDSKNRLWISTIRERGLLRYSDGELTQFSQEDGIVSEQVRVVSECEDGSILVATNEGLNVIEGDRVTQRYDQEEGLAVRLILTVAEGYNHEILAGSDGDGIYIIDSNGLRRISKEDGLPSDLVPRIKRSRSGDRYWIVTANHLSSMTPDYKVEVVQELPYANIYDIYENSNGDLWLLGGTGIYVVPASALSGGKSADATHLGMANGLYYVPTANSYSEYSQDGHLYVSGNEGVVQVDIDKPFDNTGTVRLSLPYIDCNGKRIYPESDGTFKLPSNTRKVTVFPYVLDYSLSDPQVTYRLDGFDLQSNTIRRSSLKPVDYTNLHGGQYTFVLASGRHECSIVLDKELTLYETPLFWGIIVLACIVADVWFIRYVLKRQAIRIETKKDQERIAGELVMAREIQANALPQNFPAFPDRNEFDLYASMTPAKEVGGDFYDFFLIDNDHLALVIADVSGKGIPAAMFMMVSKTLIRNQLMVGCDPATALTRVNLQLCERNTSNMFVTVWLAIIELSTGKGIACNAGHEKPGIRRAGGKFELLDYRHNLFVGSMERAKYRNREFELYPGDCIFVYTDGVPEANNPNEEMFKEPRLVEALNLNPDANPEELIHIVYDEVYRFADGAPQADDITMLCFTLNA
ncbi:MAG: SpoIIE family protein phosphatase [Atopobiaceae bacterium]|nr:SpoIIE family protein phosphatase [Atopobiaceae bacterium]